MEEKALEFFLFCLAGFCVNEIGQRALKFGRTNYYFITFYLWLRSLHFSQWSDIQSVDVGRSEWFRQRYPMLVSPLASGAFLRISSISITICSCASRHRHPGLLALSSCRDFSLAIPIPFTRPVW